MKYEKHKNDSVFLDRESERLGEIIATLGVATTKMTLPLYLSFWIVDLVYIPTHKWLFLTLRLLFVSFALHLSKRIERVETLGVAENLALYYVFAASLPINLMILLSPDPHLLYYAGVNLVIIGTLTFIPWSTKKMIYGVFLIVSPFLFIAGYKYLTGTATNISLFISTTFIFSTVFMAFIVRHFNERLRVKENQSRKDLNFEIKNRQTIIEKKTKETVALERLSAQFSPQVINAIKKGQRSLTNERTKAEICAIFVDVCDSTDRIINIPEDRFVAAIENFIAISIDTLLKFDLTIDKFYGDGILAFSNEPVKREDYIERTCLAATEIKAKIVDLRPSFNELWGKEFNFTIGVASGEALVGFYGSKTYIKQFSAIGSCLPMAQRLSSVAEKDEILISPQVAQCLSPKGFSISQKGSFSLKGWEEQILVSRIDDSSLQLFDGTMDEVCNICSTKSLFVDQKDGIYIVTCRVCGTVGGEALDSAQKAS